MRVKDKLDLSNKNYLDFLVDYRRILVVAIIIITGVLAIFIPEMRRDPTLRSGIDETSQAYQRYQKFVEDFGNEEFTLIAIKNEHGIGTPQVLKALETITQKLENLDGLDEVLSISNLRLFQKKGALFGSYPVVWTRQGKPELPPGSDMKTMKAALPIMDLMLADDFKTAGILIQIQDQWKFDLKATKQILTNVESVVKENSPPGTQYRIVGPPLIRQAIVRYNLQTGLVFGLLCALICTVVAVYVFRSMKVTAITNLILGICVLWVLGLMSLMGIPLNSTTCLSFGFIPITTLEIVIHMVVRYHQFHETTKDKIGAIKQSVRWLARPCLICSATTAVGFGTCMVSSIPMVRQLGFIMSVGIMISCGLAMILTPAFFSIMKSLDTPENGRMFRGWLDRFLLRIEEAIFRHHRAFVVVGVAITVLFFAGAPMIRSDTQMLRMLSEKTREIKDIDFVEKNLTSVNSVELVLQAGEGSFKNPAVWQKVAVLDERLKKIREVVDTDSFLPLLEYLGRVVEDTPNPKKDLFSDPALIPQLIGVTSLSLEGERMMRRHLNSDFESLHISVRIKNSPSVSLNQTIEQIRSTAEDVMKGVARPVVTGELAVMADQTSNLIVDQIEAMFLAAVIVTAIMMIQMNSVTLGLICLLPNIPPVAAVFGLMGWFQIPLDSVTVFAATVAIGLAVDNTIHFLTQLQREIRLFPEQGMEQCVRTAYRLTAKQIFSWSTVTLFGFLALAVSPFRPVVFFGILGCSSILLGLFGDLIFMQSLILTSKVIRTSIEKLTRKAMQTEA